MLRIILAIVFGYLAMGIWVMLTFSLFYLSPDFAFEKDSFEATNAWLIYALLTGLIGAILGGMVTAKVARTMSLPPVLILAALAFVGGLVMASVNAQRDKPPTGEEAAKLVATLTTKERSEKAVQPIGYAFALPFVGAAGIVAGGFLVMRRRPATS